MKWLPILCVVCMGCAGDPLKADVEMFCTATVGTTWTSFVDVAPYAAEHAKTDEFKQLLVAPTHGSMDIWQFADRVHDLMKRTGVDKCKTLDVIVRPRPID